MNFYTVNFVESVEPQHYRASVTLEPEHPVFAGHFPGNPILPGVCSLQMVVGCAEKALGYPVVMIHAPAIKFLEIVRPASGEELVIDFHVNDDFLLKAVIVSGKRTVMSCKAKLERKIFFAENQTYRKKC